jgi:hypothetical protein
MKLNTARSIAYALLLSLGVLVGYSITHFFLGGGFSIKKPDGFEFIGALSLIIVGLVTFVALMVNGIIWLQKHWND